MKKISPIDSLASSCIREYGMNSFLIFHSSLRTKETFPSFPLKKGETKHGQRLHRRHTSCVLRRTLGYGFREINQKKEFLKQL